MRHVGFGEHRIAVLRRGTRWVARIDGRALRSSHASRQEAEDAGVIEAVVIDAVRRRRDAGRQFTPPARPRDPAR